MPEIKVEIKGLDKFRKAIGKFPQIAAKNLDEAIKLSIYEIQRTTTPKVPVSEGRLKNSIRIDLIPLRGSLGFTADYATYVHEGTRPHWPPFGAGSSLERWSRLHGIIPFLVARAISVRGTKAQPFLKEGVEGAKSSIDNRMKQALENIVKEVANQSK